jgi:DNA-binding protein H-NS
MAMDRAMKDAVDTIEDALDKAKIALDELKKLLEPATEPKKQPRRGPKPDRANSTYDPHRWRRGPKK